MAVFVFDAAELGRDGLSPASSLAGGARRTFGPRVIPDEAGPALLRLNLGGMFGRPYRDPLLAPSAHMAGGWLRAALDAGQGRMAGAVLAAECVNDLVRAGAAPLFFMMCVREGGARAGAALDMADGAAEACRQAECAFAGLDTPSQGASSGPTSASAFAAGVVERQRRLDARASVGLGDAVVGVMAGGLNGAERNAVERLLPGAWLDGEPLAELGGPLSHALAAPPHVLARAMGAVFRAYRRKRVPTGAARVGEGGIPAALLRALPPGLGARLRLDAWPRPPLFTVLQRMAGLDVEGSLRVFGMGLGTLVFAPAYFAAAVVRKLARQGVEAWVIGEVTDNAGRVEVE